MISSIFKKFFDALLPHKLDRSNLQELHRGKTLSATLFFLAILAAGLFLGDIFSTEYNTEFPYIIGVNILVGFIFIYTLTNSIRIVGNLVCLSFFIIFVHQAYSNYYIFSDAIIWLIPIPLFAYLIVNSKSGFGWTIANIIVSTYFLYKSTAFLLYEFALDVFNTGFEEMEPAKYIF
ncbi:MAG: hypothetical protein ACPG4Z_08590, partial [Chitinophagales bacterium]